MRGRPNPVEALATLVQLSDGAERRASWRQAVAALGSSNASSGPPPLDGIDNDVFARAAELALDTGLADDLDWLAPGAAAVALYEITAALGPGRTRRELGRRVFARLYEGTAATFATVAARMALTSNRPFDAASLRARIGLVFDLPVGSGVNADGLALTLATRRELFERWIGRARSGTLPERRMAAKLIEHASREAVLRAQQGDLHPLRQLTSAPIKPIFAALLADREPLVWRHAAVARGLLAAVEPNLQEEIEAGLDEGLSPTEWRRSGVSLVATMVSDPEQVRSCRSIVEGPIGKQDPGIAASLIMGLPRVIEAEPDAAEELLDAVAKTRRPDVAEATAALLGDLTHATFGNRAAQQLRATLASQAESSSSVLRAIADRALRQLDRSEDGDDDLGSSLRKAMLDFEGTGARAAYEQAQRAIAASYHTLDFIESHDAHDEQVQAYVLGALSDLAAGALERSRLLDLLLLGRRPGETDASVAELERLYFRLGNWLLDAERRMTEVAPSKSAWLAEQRRLKALLHLVDVDTASTGEEGRVRSRMRQAVQVMLERVAQRPDPLVYRVACAALARACDAAVRENVCEPSEILLCCIAHVTDVSSYAMLVEASTNPDVSAALRAYADFVQPAQNEDEAERGGGLRYAERVVELSNGLGAGGSFHSEALRRTMLRIGRSLEAVAQARGQTELVDSSGSGEGVLGELELAIEDFTKLQTSAERRVLGDDPAPITVITDVPPLSSLIERSVRGGVPPNRSQLSASIKELTALLPGPIAGAIAPVLESLEHLPVSPSSDVYAIPLERRREVLPDWLLPRRTIGAFYVVRALGSGGAASVFMARRLEERNRPKAEGFALKVPAYDPTIARSLSEQEFLQLFREEAGALLSLPAHPNLARFVTFDLAARPKPILVMELIRGLGLDRLIRSHSLSLDRAFQYLDGILAGLEAMHSVGVGHLDLKPSNVILRDELTPVLVDFGLSGRQLRPGCGTLEYCAPEVVGVIPKGHSPTPMAADIYAFGCLAFEILSAQTLFEGDDEMKILGMHVEHDGWPPKLAPIGRDARFGELGVFLAACLRRDPTQRPTAKQARRALAPLIAKYADDAWPVSAQGQAARSA
jgi:eukaryotic-like serine/threonine-protein kinase